MLRVNAERLPRFILAGLILGLILYFIVKNWNTSLAWTFAGGLIFLAIFNFRYAVLDGRTYSLSSVAGSDDIIGFTAITAFVAFASAWLVVFLVRGLFKQSAGRATESAFMLTFITLFLTCLPLLWSFALNGALIGWILPDMASMFLGFLAILQLLIVAAAGLVLAGASAGIASIVGKKKTN